MLVRVLALLVRHQGQFQLDMFAREHPLIQYPPNYIGGAGEFAELGRKLRGSLFETAEPTARNLLIEAQTIFSVVGTRNDLIEDVRQLLARAGFYVSERCDIRPISFDMMARRDETLLVLKVLGNADALNERVAQELRTLAKFLKASPILIAQRTGSGPLEDGVLYTHRGIPAMTLGSMKDHLIENTAPMAFASPGGLYVNIRAEMLKLLRMQRALSLGMLAQVAGVSRRAIQMYEEGMHATIDSALRLEEYLQESLVEPIDPFRAFNPKKSEEAAPVETVSRAMNEFEDAVMRMLRSVGFRVVPTRQSPFNALTQSADTILTGVEGKDAMDAKRAKILSSVRGVSETDAMYVVGRDTTKTNVHGTPVIQRRELEKMRDPKELLDLLQERERREKKA